ncbi:electron transfer flavoprotein subunit beta [Peptostreptococcaceae bacterium oral taxon 113 str. W5053]|nr:electron transfer flavoprotein subunit beta [Peptostreptococcaceae bacterium oral taxon 113 str. W5053]
MNILVCIKQVPDTTEIKIDPVTNTLIRQGAPSIINTFDAYALELAVRVKEQYSGKVTVISMGPEQAKEALKECLSVGADEAYLISDRIFGGSDTLATSYILSKFINVLEAEHGKYDLILCGKQAIDGDTGQVGPEIAEHLGIPQVTYITDMKLEDNFLLVKRDNDNGFDWIEVEIPALVTVTKTNFEPRYATIRSKMQANKRNIPVLTSNDAALDFAQCGLKGSPTKVKKTYTPVRQKNGVIIKEENSKTAVKKFIIWANDTKVF